MKTLIRPNSFRRAFQLFTLVILTRHLPLSGAQESESPLGQFDGQSDLGKPSLPGGAIYQAANQEYTITGTGTNMWAGRDQFHFVWKRMRGDFVVQARVEFLGQGVDPHRKLGWMVRPNMNPDAPYADVALHGDGHVALQYRRMTGGVTDQVKSTLTGADVIQLSRRGKRIAMAAARFGEPFTTNELADVEFETGIYVGLFVCAHNGNVSEQAVFQDVRITTPAKAGFVPYRDYIGSQLEILDVQSGHSEIIHSSRQPFEAPNWTRDGSALIYNSSGRSTNSGRLYRFDLARREATLINTDFADHNNNDHVLSFDGTMLGISHRSTNHGNQSTVFSVPATGGIPRAITPALGPSYFHGWSPDGKSMVYTGGRKEKFDIYNITASGGDEIRLTDAPGLNDGPEFTPDGQWIYFNSSRTGLMQIWRMKPDGSGQEQITHDDFNNWFPHISPDGKWIALITFPKEIDPADHPYYKQVYLRLLPITGGTPKVIAYVYGGQGTMNVPSWSPDSRRLAFVSNSDLP